MSTHPLEQLAMERFLKHIEHCLLYEYQQGHTEEEALRNIDKYVTHESESITNFWYDRFKQGKFELSDSSASGEPSTIELEEEQAIIKGYGLHRYVAYDLSQPASPSDSEKRFPSPTGEMETDAPEK